MFWLSIAYIGSTVEVIKLHDGRELRQLVGGEGQESLAVSDYGEDACTESRPRRVETVPVARILSIDLNETKGQTMLSIKVVCSRGRLTAKWQNVHYLRSAGLNKSVGRSAPECPT